MSIFTVTTLSEETDGLYLGGVSLREAITAANATPGRDIIRFDAGLSGAISLTEGEFAITDSVVIQGLGADTLTIDAGGNSRVFNIDDGSDSASEVVIRGLTITGGYSEDDGGGIYSSEVLRVFDSVITDNSATDGGGIYSDESILLVRNSEISGNSTTNHGGGIYANDGDVRIVDSEISGNSATNHGGGLYQDNGKVSIIRSDITENSADDGGGVYNDDGNLTIVTSTLDLNSAVDGGGVYAGSSSAVRIVNNSEISGNSAEYGGGIYNEDGGVVIVNSSSITENTATEAGGGVYNVGTFKASNSTIEGNIFGDDEFGFPEEFYGPAGVIVAGTNDDDEILGSNSDDIIRGRQGDDILAGGAGDDDLFGQAGSDVLIGFDPLIGLPILGLESVSPAYDDSMYEYPMPGAGEIDVLTGGGGADLFVLGSFIGPGPGPEPFSVEPTEIGFGLAYSASGEDDYALIKDFSAQDTILLDGFAEMYQLGLAPAGLSGVGISTTDGELIAIVQGNAALDLDLESGTGFEFSCGCMG